MNRGLKHYTKQLTQEVGGASCSVNLNKEDANLHITIPLIKTVGLDPIDLSLIFNLQDFNNDSNNCLFGKGSKLNLFTRYTDTTSKITLLNADGASDEYLSTKNFYNSETQLTINKVQYTGSQYIYQVKDKYGNQRDFYNGINYPKQITMKSGATITTDFQTTQPYLSNGRGDKVQFAVNSSGLTTKLTYLHDNIEVYRTEIEYYNDRITKVKYMLGENLMSSITISYGGYYFEVIDDVTGYRIMYIFSGNKVINIVSGYNSSYTNSLNTTISYDNNKTTVTNYKGENSYYYFDTNQLPLFEMDEKGNVVETEYDLSSKLLVSKNTPINAKDYSLNILPSKNVNIFTRESVSLSSVNVTDPIFSNLLGDTIYRATGNTVAVNRLSYRLNVSGVASDSITAVIFGKQLTNFSENNFVKVTLRAGSYDIDVDYFKKQNIDNQFDLMVLGVSPTQSYDFIDLEFTIYGQTEIELGGVQIIKKEFGEFYQYDEKGNVTKNGFGLWENNISYNNDNMVSQVIYKDSNMNNFEYDSYGKLVKYTTSYGVKIENNYDEVYRDNLLSVKTSTADGNKILETKKEYTTDGRFLSKEIDEMGSETTYDLYDLFGRIRKITNALNSVMEYDYHGNGTLKQILMSNSTDSIYANYYYDSKKRLTNISLKNGSSYQFVYDDYNNLIAIKFNEVVIFEYTYDLSTGNILTQKNGVSGDGYKFIYNSTDSSLIEEIHYFDSNGIETFKYRYVYDNKKRLIRVYDNYDDIIYAYDYDNNGRISIITGEYIQIKNKYDDLGNIVCKSSSVSNNKIYTTYDFNSKSKGDHPESLSVSGPGYIGVFNLDSNIYNGTNVINSISHMNNVIDLPRSKEGVINCVNVDSNNLMSYRMGAISMPLECGCVQFWFKPSATNVGPDFMECLFSTKNNNGSGSIFLSAEGGRLSLFVIDDYGNEHHLLSSDYGINYGEWNFVSLNFINRNDGSNYDDITEYHMILNKHSQTYLKKNPGLRVSLGENPIYNIGHYFNGNSCSQCFDGKIAALRIMPRNYCDITEIYKYYQLTNKYIFDNTLVDEDNTSVDFSQCTLLTTDKTLHDKFEIFPLQNNVESLNGIKPIKFDLVKVSNLDKFGTFAFNKKIKKYAYVANGSQLVYDFGQFSEGTIAVRVYLDDLTEKQYIFQLKDQSGNSIGLFRRSGGLISIEINEQEIVTNLTCNPKEWFNVALSFNETIVSDSETESNVMNLRLIVNESVYSTTIEKTFTLGSLKLSLGRTIDYLQEHTSFGIYYNVYPLYGQLEMLAFSKAFCELSTIKNLFNESESVVKVHEFDELGMINKISLHKNGKDFLTKMYEYKTRDDTRYITKLVKKEKVYCKSNLLTNRTYTYDKLGRVISINDDYFGNHNYKYDYRGYLSEADLVKYTYDENGNILSIGNKTFSYDSTIKDLLIKVGDKSITYDANKPGIIKSYGNCSYIFEGRRLKSFNNSNNEYNYVYDDRGLRTSKYSNEGTWIYQYDGDKLVYQYHSGERLDFLYDENGELYGFVKDNADKYFYIRDHLKNILGIVNDKGDIVVKYSYDPFGLCDSIAGTLATTIGKSNPFRFKGYYYDEESNMYYCKSRYYVPEWGRWLTCDTPNFLEIKNILGLNLFAYCGNNPINAIDENGQFWFTIMTTAVGAIVGACSAIVNSIILEEEITAKTVIGGAINGAVTGFILGTTKGTAIATASFVAAAAESAFYEIYDYASGEKELTTENFIHSVVDVGIDTIINGGVNYVCNKSASLIPSLKTNPGWFKPQSASSYLTKSYGQKMIGQTVVGASSGTLLHTLTSKAKEKIHTFVDEIIDELVSREAMDII